MSDIPPGAKEYVIQLGPTPGPNRNGDSFPLDGPARFLSSRKVVAGMPVTYKGEVVGEITDVVQDEICFALYKKHENLMKEIFNGK